MTENVEGTEQPQENEGLKLPKTMLFRMNGTGEEFIGQLVGVIPDENDPNVTSRLIVREPVVIVRGESEDDKLQFVQWCLMSKNRVFNFTPDIFLMVIDARDDIVDEYNTLIIKPLDEAEKEAQEDKGSDES